MIIDLNKCSKKPYKIQRDVLERKDILKTRLIAFHGWLKTDAPRTNPKGEVIGKGLGVQ